MHEKVSQEKIEIKKKKKPRKLSCKWSQVNILSTTQKTIKHLVQQEQRTWTNETLLAPLNDSKN